MGKSFVDVSSMLHSPLGCTPASLRARISLRAVNSQCSRTSESDHFLFSPRWLAPFEFHLVLGYDSQGTRCCTDFDSLKFCGFTTNATLSARGQEIDHKEDTPATNSTVAQHGKTSSSPENVQRTTMMQTSKLGSPSTRNQPCAERHRKRKHFMQQINDGGTEELNSKGHDNRRRQPTWAMEKVQWQTLATGKEKRRCTRSAWLLSRDMVAIFHSILADISWPRDFSPRWYHKFTAGWLALGNNHVLYKLV